MSGGPKCAVDGCKLIAWERGLCGRHLSPARRPIDEHDDNYYSTDEAARLAGVSFRQADYWNRTGVLGPKGNGSGSPRRWSIEQVSTLRLLAGLKLAVDAQSGKALTVDLLGAAARCFEAAGHPDHGWLVVHRDRAVFVPIEKALASTIRSVGAALVVDLAAAVAVDAREATCV